MYSITLCYLSDFGILILYYIRKNPYTYEMINIITYSHIGLSLLNSNLWCNLILDHW